MFFSEHFSVCHIFPWLPWYLFLVFWLHICLWTKKGWKASHLPCQTHKTLLEWTATLCEDTHTHSIYSLIYLFAYLLIIFLWPMVPPHCKVPLTGSDTRWECRPKGGGRACLTVWRIQLRCVSCTVEAAYALFLTLPIFAHHLLSGGCGRWLEPVGAMAAVLQDVWWWSEVLLQTVHWPGTTEWGEVLWGPKGAVSVLQHAAVQQRWWWDSAPWY